MSSTAAGLFLNSSLSTSSLSKHDVRFKTFQLFPLPCLPTLIGRTLEETAALFEGDDHPEDLQAMGGQAAHMSMRLSKVSFLEPAETKEEPRRNHYEMKKRYRVSDTTSTSTDYNAPPVSMPMLRVTEP